MRAVDLIDQKARGEELPPEAIAWLIAGATAGTIPDYQLAAWLMAVVWRGMTDRETHALTQAMVDSGTVVELPELGVPTVDKHSTGGVGDKATLVVAPLAATCGLAVAKMTGRGLAHTGGTVDKLESITGFNASLDREQFLDILRAHHLVLSGQSGDLAPADGQLYALRDATATVRSIPLIASSVMSKKLAVATDAILLDVKVGSGAFMPDLESARELARLMVAIGEQAGRRVRAVLTNMDQPLGRAVGNALELREAIDTLRGQGPADFAELCHHETVELLLLASLTEDRHEAAGWVRGAIETGAGWRKLCDVIAAQGGDRTEVEDPGALPRARYVVPVEAEQAGVVASIDAEAIGLASMRLGAGREKKGDPVDHAVGLVLRAKVGDRVEPGQPLADIHANDPSRLTAAKQAEQAAYRWSASPVAPPPLLLEVVG